MMRSQSSNTGGPSSARASVDPAAHYHQGLPPIMPTLHRTAHNAAETSPRQFSRAPVQRHAVEAPFLVKDKVAALENYPVIAEARSSVDANRPMPLPVTVVGMNSAVKKFDPTIKRTVGTGGLFIPEDLHEAIVAETVARLADVFQHRLQEQAIAATIRYFTDLSDEALLRAVGERGPLDGTPSGGISAAHIRAHLPHSHSARLPAVDHREMIGRASADPPYSSSLIRSATPSKTFARHGGLKSHSSSSFVPVKPNASSATPLSAHSRQFAAALKKHPALHAPWLKKPLVVPAEENCQPLPFEETHQHSPHAEEALRSILTSGDGGDLNANVAPTADDGGKSNPTPTNRGNSSDVPTTTLGEQPSQQQGANESDTSAGKGRKRHRHRRKKVSQPVDAASVMKEGAWSTTEDSAASDSGNKKERLRKLDPKGSPKERSGWNKGFVTHGALSNPREVYAADAPYVDKKVPFLQRDDKDQGQWDKEFVAHGALSNPREVYAADAPYVDKKVPFLQRDDKDRGQWDNEFVAHGALSNPREVYAADAPYVDKKVPFLQRDDKDQGQWDKEFVAHGALSNPREVYAADAPYVDKKVPFLQRDDKDRGQWDNEFVAHGALSNPHEVYAADAPYVDKKVPHEQRTERESEWGGDRDAFGEPISAYCREGQGTLGIGSALSTTLGYSKSRQRYDPLVDIAVTPEQMSAMLRETDEQRRQRNEASSGPKRSRPSKPDSRNVAGGLGVKGTEGADKESRSSSCSGDSASDTSSAASEPSAVTRQGKAGAPLSTCMSHIRIDEAGRPIVSRSTKKRSSKEKRSSPQNTLPNLKEASAFDDMEPDNSETPRNRKQLFLANNFGTDSYPQVSDGDIPPQPPSPASLALQQFQHKAAGLRERSPEGGSRLPRNEFNIVSPSLAEASIRNTQSPEAGGRGWSRGGLDRRMRVPLLVGGLFSKSPRVKTSKDEGPRAPASLIGQRGKHGSPVDRYAQLGDRQNALTPSVLQAHMHSADVKKHPYIIAVEDQAMNTAALAAKNAKYSPPKPILGPAVPDTIRSMLPVPMVPISPLKDEKPRVISLEHTILEAQVERDVILQEYSTMTEPLRNIKATVDDSANALKEAVEAKLLFKEDLVKKYEALQNVRAMHDEVMDVIGNVHELLVMSKGGIDQIGLDKVAKSMKVIAGEKRVSVADRRKSRKVSVLVSNTEPEGQKARRRKKKKATEGEAAPTQDGGESGASDDDSDSDSDSEGDSRSSRSGDDVSDDFDARAVTAAPQDSKARKESRSVDNDRKAPAQGRSASTVSAKVAGGIKKLQETVGSLGGRRGTKQTTPQDSSIPGGSKPVYNTAELLKEARRSRLASMMGNSTSTAPNTTEERKPRVRVPAERKPQDTSVVRNTNEELELKKMSNRGSILLGETKKRFTDAHAYLVSHGRHLLSTKGAATVPTGAPKKAIASPNTSKPSMQLSSPLFSANDQMPLDPQQEHLAITTAILEELNAEFRDINFRRDAQRVLAEQQEHELDDIRGDMKRLTTGNEKARDEAAMMLSEMAAEYNRRESDQMMTEYVGSREDPDGDAFGDNAHPSQGGPEYVVGPLGIAKRRQTISDDVDEFGFDPLTTKGRFVQTMHASVQADESQISQKALTPEQSGQMEDLYRLERFLLASVKRLMVAVANIMMFHQAIEVELTCKHCWKLFETPRVLWPCGHCFCDECVVEMFVTGSVECIVCSECRSITDIGFTPNPVIENIANYHIQNREERSESNKPNGSVALKGILQALLDDLSSAQEETSDELFDASLTFVRRAVATKL